MGRFTNRSDSWCRHLEQSQKVDISLLNKKSDCQMTVAFLI